MQGVRSAFVVLAVLGLVGSCGGGGGERTGFQPLDHNPLPEVPAGPDLSGGETSGDTQEPGPKVDLLSLTTFQPATGLIGQADFFGQQPNRGAGPSDKSLRGCGSVAVGTHLWVADPLNNRILRYTLPLSGLGPSADIVLGQIDMTSSAAGLTEGDFDTPGDVEISGTKLLISDGGNNRILIYNSLPTQTAESGHVVVGQAGFYTKTAATSATGLRGPANICVANGKLIVADTGNSRVLIWNQIPTSHGTAADLVLGQKDFTSMGHELSATGMKYPTGVWSDGTKLIVVDYFHHRVLIWNTFPTQNGEAAHVVLGQPDFKSTTTNQVSGIGWPHAVPHPDVMWHPYDVASNGRQIVVSDNGMRRVLIWNSWPLTNHERPHVVLGQGDFFHGWPNDDDQNWTQDATPTARTVRATTGVHIDGTKLYVSDWYNNRLLIFE